MPFLQYRSGAAALCRSDLNRAEINLKIIIDPSFDCIGEGIVSSIFCLKIVNQDPVFIRINDPVFTDASLLVFEQLGKIIHSSAGRRDNFNDPVRRKPENK